MSGIFVTGTDTGVGKTYITAALTYALRKDGIDAIAMKPIATGSDVNKGIFKSLDAVILAKYSNVDSNEYELINPVFLAEEASPYMASKMLNTSIDIGKVLNAYNELKKRHEFILVEGIGGIMVPISKGYYVADLIRDLGLPVLIVARAKLGTINHTMLTVMACKEYKLNILGIVINMIDYSNKVEANTPSIIEELSSVPIIGCVPLISNISIDKIPEIAEHIRYDLIIT
jgi:dethiobiotin synthetase